MRDWCNPHRLACRLQSAATQVDGRTMGNDVGCERHVARAAVSRSMVRPSILRMLMLIILAGTVVSGCGRGPAGAKGERGPPGPKVTRGPPASGSG